MEPGDSAEGVSAVEVAAEAAPRHAPSFFHGALAGIAIAAVVAQVWLAVQLAPLRGAFQDMASKEPFVLRPWWLWGVPGAGAAAVAALMVLRPRRVVGYVLVAVLLVGLAIATWHLAYAPLYQLADEIKD